uniref:BTB domain-containing protein n=1 Tax=Panagrolaimus sp. ES5 TaxID=591445 RepID=A0AC34FD48_9BILA
MDVQIEDPECDKIIFNFPWIYTIPAATNEIGEISRSIKTSYKMGSAEWFMYLRKTEICIHTPYDESTFDNGCCFVSYILFYDADMRYEYYSSSKIQAEISENNEFISPVGYMDKFAGAISARKISKIVVHFELHLPVKYFFYPYERSSSYLSKRCPKYPKDISTDYKFAFLNKGDFVIKCPDGTVPASKQVLYVSSSAKFRSVMDELDDKFTDLDRINPASLSISMEKQRIFKSDELTVPHSTDVVKPIIVFLHTYRFEMPKFYDLNYIPRLFEVIEFFKGDRIYLLESSIKILLCNSIEESLCVKLVEEPLDMNSVLQWIAVSFKHHFNELKNMLCVLIANKFFFKWSEIFPEDARNSDNPQHREVFGLESSTKFFNDIFGIFNDSILSNVIFE